MVENGDAVDKLRVFLAETDSDRRNLSPDQLAKLRELVGLGHCARVGGEDLLLEDVTLRHVLGVLALEPLHGHNLAICEWLGHKMLSMSFQAGRRLGQNKGWMCDAPARYLVWCASLSFPFNEVHCPGEFRERVSKILERV